MEDFLSGRRRTGEEQWEFGLEGDWVQEIADALSIPHTIHRPKAHLAHVAAHLPLRLHQLG